MLRVLGIPAILLTLFIGAYLSTQEMRKNGPTSPAGQQEIAQAHSATAGLNFNQAVPGLQAYFDENHTYVGATLPPGSEVRLLCEQEARIKQRVAQIQSTLPPGIQVTLAGAGATSYCLQSGNEHEVGPGGTPQPGPC